MENLNQLLANATPVNSADRVGSASIDRSDQASAHVSARDVIDSAIAAGSSSGFYAACNTERKPAHELHSELAALRDITRRPPAPPSVKQVLGEVRRPSDMAGNSADLRVLNSYTVAGNQTDISDFAKGMVSRVISNEKVDARRIKCYQAYVTYLAGALDKLAEAAPAHNAKVDEYRAAVAATVAAEARFEAQTALELEVTSSDYSRLESARASNAEVATLKSELEAMKKGQSKSIAAAVKAAVAKLSK